MNDAYPPIERAEWRRLSEPEHAEVWERFYEKFDYRPEGGLTRLAIKEPVPSVTFDLRGCEEGGEFAAAVEAIESEALRSFVDALADVEALFVLDYNHPSFEVRFREERRERWPVGLWSPMPGVYPDGDYYAYLTPDFTEGTFGSPTEPSLCVFGPRLVGSLAMALSDWLPIKRVDGDASGVLHTEGLRGT